MGILATEVTEVSYDAIVRSAMIGRAAIAARSFSPI
jgi:hypothetical protein